MKTHLFIVLVTLLVLKTTGFSQGNLTPSGPPQPTMKTLDQVQPLSIITNLPYTISQSGSYYLASNLTGPSFQPGITIAADDVTIDLMGFTLTGGTNAANGILVSSPKKNLTVKNGKLRKWNIAINLSGPDGAGHVIEKVTVLESSSSGFYLAAPGTVIRNCAAFNNGGTGIDMAQGSQVIDCNVSSNGFVGITVGPGSVVQDCIARYSQYQGIGAQDGSTIRGCTVSTNGSGISAGSYCTIKECTAYSNRGNGISASSGNTIDGCTAGLNSGDGISVGDGNTVTGCTVRKNGEHGILAITSNFIRENLSDSNGQKLAGHAGIFVDLNNRIENNLCNSAAHGIYLALTNNVVIRNVLGKNINALTYGVPNFYGAPIKTNDLGGQINVTTANPWANFEYK